jgi:spore coat protein H
MEEIELFELFYSYCELKINDHYEGIYMLLERPQDWALEKKHSPCIIRRGFDNKIDKLRSGKKIENKETQNNKQQFKQIYKSLNKYDGAELYTVLSQWIDLEMYMKWLAFNFYMRNGDYTDEVYFYIDSVTGKYKIILWDYDDIFAHEPHEGTEEKLRIIGQKLIFSSEDLLDQKIASDPYLYQMYLNQLSDVLHQLTRDKIKIEMEITFAELYPYYEKYEIISMSRYDVYKDISMESLKSNLDRVYTRLIRHRMNCLDYLDKRSKNTAH